MLLHLIADDRVVVGDLTKRDLWPLLVPVAWFCRVSGGRVALPDAPPSWQRIEHRTACFAVPWLIRCAALSATSRWLTGWTPVDAVEWVRSPFKGGVLQHPWHEEEPSAPWRDGGLTARIDRCYDG